MIAYHVTLTANVDSILKQGLVPKVGERSGLLGEPHPAIYLFHSLEDLDTALGQWLGDELEDEDIRILFVNLENINHNIEAYEVQVFSPISPDRIIKVITEDELVELL